MRRPTTLAILTGAGLLSLAAADGINCEGNRKCSPGLTTNNGLDKHDDLIDEFYQALANGASMYVPGGPIAATSLYYYHAPGQEYIACSSKGNICMWIQGNNVPSQGVNGSVLVDRIGDLNSHGCWYCGSVPLSGNNNPDVMGILTVNYVSDTGNCSGVCVPGSGTT